MNLRALIFLAALAPSTVLADGPVLSAHNIAGPAMTYDGIDFSADAGEANGLERAETKRRSGRNGYQEALVGTPFATLRRERKRGDAVVFAAPVPAVPITVELYFMEIFHRSPGKRRMKIEIEGQIVQEEFDVLEASGGDVNTPQILQFTDIDPATLGDPDKLDLRVIGMNDVSVRSAVVLRGGTDDGACAEQAEIAADQRQIAQVAADAAARKRWQGFWRQSWDGGYTVNIASTDEGAHMVMKLKNTFCTAAFEPGASPSEMELVAYECLTAPGKIANLRLEEARDGRLRVAMEINGRDWDVEIPKEISLPVGPSVRPEGFEFSTANITLEATWAEQKASVDARLQKVGITPDWQTEKLSRLVGDVYAYIHRANEPGDYRNYEGEHYSVYTIGTGDSAVPFGVLRRWLPAADKRPTYDGLLNAVRGRYGPETRLLTTNRAGRKFTLGLNWAFSRNGEKLKEGCSGPYAFRHSLRLLPGHSVGMMRMNLTAPWQYGCGLQLYFNHSAPETMEQILAMQAALIDSAPIEIMLWEQYSGDVARRIERVKERAAEAQAEQEEKDGVQPDL
ncbi:MAG: malectin domain-containing carbohydrate-binding protein [Pseudomonadota bacterium]